MRKHNVPAYHFVPNHHSCQLVEPYSFIAGSGIHFPGLCFQKFFVYGAHWTTKYQFGLNETST